MRVLQTFRRGMLTTSFSMLSQKQTYVITLALGFLIQLCALGFGRFAYTALLPSMKSDLGLTSTHMGFFQVGILVGYLLFAYLCSFFSKRWGLSLVISASCAAVGLAMMALGFASSFSLCLVLAFLIGSGAAGAYIPLIPLIIGWSSLRRSGSALGIIMSGCGVGIIVVGYVTPLILERFGMGGWRHAWVILGAASLLVALASMFLLKDLTATFMVPFFLSALIICACPLFLLFLKKETIRR